MNDSLNQDIINANKTLFERYKNIVINNDIPNLKNVNKEYLKNFCETAINTEMREDKHSRWLGFIQGVLFSFGLIDLEEERNISRKLFQSIYKKYNIIQETVSI